MSKYFYVVMVRLMEATFRSGLHLVNSCSYHVEATSEGGLHKGHSNMTT